jgi:hypothetical protein
VGLQAISYKCQARHHQTRVEKDEHRNRMADDEKYRNL